MKRRALYEPWEGRVPPRPTLSGKNGRGWNRALPGLGRFMASLQVRGAEVFAFHEPAGGPRGFEVRGLVPAFFKRLVAVAGATLPLATLSPAMSWLADESASRKAATSRRTPRRGLVWLAALLVFLGTAGTGSTADAVTESFQKALFEEEANHNLAAAIEAYRAVLAAHDDQRRLAATAVFRLGECYRKLGKTNDAVAQFQRVVRDFSDQSMLANLSEQNLFALGASLPGAAPGPAARARARQHTRERSLILEEITVAERQLKEARKRIEAGTLPLTGGIIYERAVARLKRELAALEEAPAGPQQRDLLEQEIRLQEQMVEAVKQALANGRAFPGQELEEQRALLSLKRELVGLSAAAGESPAANEPGATGEEEMEIRRIRAMIRDSPDLINASDSQSKTTPLARAAEAGQLVVARFLLANRAEVNGSSGGNRSRPLHFAAMKGHKSMVELLLANGAEVDALSPGGQTPLHLAAAEGFRSVVELLLAHQADPNLRDASDNAALHSAVRNGHRQVAELLISRGADVNANRRRSPTSGSGTSESARPYYGTALHFAVNRKETALVELLLAHHADVTARSPLLESPLDIAAMGGDAAVAALLLKAGADVNATAPPGTHAGWTALHHAAQSGNREVTELLLRHGANPNVRASLGITPLLLAAKRLSEEIGMALLDHKADPNIKTDEGNAPLHQAILSCRSLVRPLLAHGADVAASDSNGETPLTLAVGYADKDIVDLLLEHKADVNARSTKSLTPLHVAIHVAISHNKKDVAELLLAHNADPNATDASGRTPLDYVKLGRNTALTPIPTPRINSRSPDYSSQGLAELAGVLRKAGAMDDLPRLDRIVVRRPFTGYESVVFQRSTNDWNRFTLLELVAVEYGFLTTHAGGGTAPTRANYSSRAEPFLPMMANQSGKPSSLEFPALGAITIRRPAGPGKSSTTQEVNLQRVLKSGDCSQDVALEWGDVVEIPELDHPVAQPWPGLPADLLTTLKKCLSRTIQITVKGETVTHELAPAITFEAGGIPSCRSNEPFGLVPVLYNSKVLRTSSDLSRVRVRRRDPATGLTTREITINCTEWPLPNLWLRNGDVIEVPEKEN